MGLLFINVHPSITIVAFFSFIPIPKAKCEIKKIKNKKREKRNAWYSLCLPFCDLSHSRSDAFVHVKALIQKYPDIL